MKRNRKPKLTGEAGKDRRVKLLGYAAVLMLLVILPFFSQRHIQSVLSKFILMSLFTVSYDVIFGYTGLLSLGHAVFFGIGAYVVGVMALHFGGGSLWIALLAAVALTVVAAALCGLIALRFRGVSLLLVTFALGMLFYAIAWNVPWLSQSGMQGIAGIGDPDLGFVAVEWTNRKFYFLCLAFFALSYWLISRLVASPYGHVLVGIRESEDRMKALGYNTYAYKFTAYLISAAFASISGVLYAYWNSIVTPSFFTLDYSFLPMAMAIIGTSGTLYGGVIGAAIYVFGEYFVSCVTPERWPMIMGMIFVLSIMFLRKGVARTVIEAVRKRRTGKQPAAVGEARI
jgi:branched-chain amino acid transport system permease protein